MSLTEGLSFGGFALTTLAFMWKLSFDEEGKRGRLYKRIDELKETNRKEFSSKEICTLLHKQIADDLTEIKTDIKVLLRGNGHGQGKVDK